MMRFLTSHQIPYRVGTTLTYPPLDVMTTSRAKLLTAFRRLVSLWGHAFNGPRYISITTSNPTLA